MNKQLNELAKLIPKCLLRAQFRFRRELNALKKQSGKAADWPQKLSQLEEKIRSSVAACDKRLSDLPKPNFDTSLPIYERREEIADAIKNNQVIVVSGATGSGKSTQLPLIAMELGYGVRGMIGHTQPRRIAARGVAARIASQLGSPVGQAVGFKIRFSDQTDERTYLKLMTDGILLAETQSDRFLDQYELLIVDEAHERSLNIDFLLGCLKKILRRRPELRLMITSATIDTQKFADHFTLDEAKPVPVLNVEGRSFPVDIEYRDPAEWKTSSDSEMESLVVDSCEQLCARGHGDVLVFLPTEAEIRSVHKKLRSANLGRSATEILPLYSRLSTDQQNKIFQPHKSRRIVLATNVAESSITVPGIKYVVDTGTARISRYAPRSKVQRLPIEPISKASAKQRAGRCGRVEPGICIRLYSQEDFEGRSDFTTPEIRRTNLAAVILQTLSLKLGEISEFPFIDPPGNESIRDGFKTLFEIGAVDDRRRLTDLGRKLARLPVDPRIGRMIFQADEENCLAEILIIASALELQDPRVRPVEKKQAADEQHAKFNDPKSDFMSRLKLWDFFHKLKEDLSRSKLRLACQQNFLSFSLLQQWQDIHRQLKAMVHTLGLKPHSRSNDYNGIHRSLLAGLLSGVALLGDRHEYTGVGGIKFHLWPGSGIFESKPKWIMAAEIVETTRRYGRTVAKISPEWIASLANHLLKKHYSDPHWSKKQQTVLANERVTLFGLPIVASRKANYGRINPEEAREIFIDLGITTGEYEGVNKFYAHNIQLLEDIKSEAAKTRNRELIVDSYLVAGFYYQKLPTEAVDTASLRKLIGKDPKIDQQLMMSREDLLPDANNSLDSTLFPNEVQIGAMHVPVKYAFAPGASNDGATIEIPVEGIGQVDDIQTGWLIPGLLQERIVALIRSLPKPLRRNLVPAPETATRVAKEIEFGVGSFLEAVSRGLTRIGGTPISPSEFKPEKLDTHLNVNLRLLDNDGEVLAEGRSIASIREQLGAEFSSNVVEVEDQTWRQDGLKEWGWDELPEEIMIQRGVTKLAAFPAIVDQGDSIGIRVFDSKAASQQQSRMGLTRLLRILNRKSIKSQVNWLPNLDAHAIRLSRCLPAKELRDQLGDLIVQIGFIGNKKVPRTRDAFDQLISGAVEKIGVATQEVSIWLPKWSEAAHAAYLAVEELPARFSFAKGDIRSQMKMLTTSGFLRTTPWNWLRNFPRYYVAISQRIEKLATTPPEKDRAFADELKLLWDRYETTKARQELQAIIDPELETFRWMLEEYRVSLFAQNLGTAVTISAKRMEKQWNKVRNV